MNIISPQQDVKQHLLNRVIEENWPKDIFRELTEIDKIKKFYNDCYKSLLSQLEHEISKYHPSAWILEAYKQLEIWTVVYHQTNCDNVLGNIYFAPAARYGWRYVIEICLEKSTLEFDSKQKRPSLESLNIVFTILLGMAQSSEYSNYLHFFKEEITSAKIIFSPNLLTKHPEVKINGKDFFTSLEQLLVDKIRWDKYEGITPNSIKMTNEVDGFLMKHFSISHDEIFTIIRSLAMRQDTQASIEVQPVNKYEKLVSLLSDMSLEKIKSLIEISMLNIDKNNNDKRDYLKKTQRKRMFFYAGIKLDLNSNFDAIYDSSISKESFITSSQKHIIISPLLYAEWLDLFVHKIVLGQRDDLKKNQNLKQDIINIEASYRKLFEKEVQGILLSHDFKCILNFSKYNKRALECGEIDIIAFNPNSKELFIVECKAYAPVIDARGGSQVLKDHYRQKKYHLKFLRKVEWVEENNQTIRQLFKTRFDIDVGDNYKIYPYFVTLSKSVLSLFEDKYKIVTFYELDEMLKNELR